MDLKDNRYYWNISLKNPEPLADEYYVFDNIIITQELTQKVEKLRKLTATYCVLIEKNKEEANKIFNDIYQIVTSTENIQYTEFVAFWKTLDISYSIFKKLPNNRDILKDLLSEYCKKRQNLYNKLGHSDLVIQALYDNGTSRKKGNAAIEKIVDIVKSIFNDIRKANSLEDFEKLNITYILPDKKDKKLFKEFLKKSKLKFSYGRGKQNKFPDFLLKCDKHILIIEAKHLKEPGGKQNESVYELIEFIKQQEHNPYIHYVSFLDGIYFNLLIDPPRTRRENENKIKRQRESIESALDEYKNNFFVNTAGFKTLLEDLAKGCL